MRGGAALLLLLGACASAGSNATSDASVGANDGAVDGAMIMADARVMSDAAADAAPPPDYVVEAPCPTSVVPATGTFTSIYDPSVGETGSWYVNAHTLIRAQNGTWHLFGSTHAEPQNPGDERFLAHATASALTGPWTKQASVLPYDTVTGETVVWGPHVIYDSGTYYMFYVGGGSDPTQFQMRLATSTNLSTWTRRTTPLFTDGYQARDPFVIKIGSQWVMYYTATQPAAGGSRVVAYRTSADLITWSARAVAYTDPSTGMGGGNTESPVVVQRGTDYYLFIGPRGGYAGTDVFRSTNPFSFTLANRIGHYAAHAAEVVQDASGNWFMTGAGWGQLGVHLAPLTWATPKCYDIDTPNYHVTIQTSPVAALLSYRRTSDQELLGNAYHGTVPYISIGEFGNWSTPAGPPATTTVSGTRKHVITLANVSFGASRQRGAALPVTADWAFCFDDDGFEHKLTWKVQTSIASVWEAGLDLETSFSTLGNPGNLNRTGDVAGFPTWTLAGSSTRSLIAAYRTTTSFSVDNHWFSPTEKRVAWQSVWSNGGKTFAAGTHAGGRWRMEASAVGSDTALANSLASKPTCFP